MRIFAILSLACAIALASRAPAAAQVRLDLGLIVPQELDLVSEDAESANAKAFLEEWPALPLPEIGLHYQWDLGKLKLGAGMRAFTLVAESLAWPDAYAELDLGRLSIDAKAGAGAFAMFGLLSRSALGRVFIPDLSAWWKVGRSSSFGLGAGAMGLYVPDALGKTMTLLFYVGGKASLMF